MKRRYRKQTFTDGFSESAWKSLVVKSVRMGWPAGLDEAARRLTRSKIQYLLLTSVFEDIFPAIEDLERVFAEARALDFPALCRHQTHHARGYTPEFCRLEEPATRAAATERPAIWAEARKRGLWLPNRALNTFWTWLEIRPTDAGVRRRVDKAPWAGMPPAILDGHTYEGRRDRVVATVLSGDYNTHGELGKRVRRHGWGPIRREVHAEAIVKGRAHAKQNRLF